MQQNWYNLVITLFFITCISYGAVKGKASTEVVSPENSTNSGTFLFELLMVKLDYLEYKFLELQFNVKEHNIGVEQNQANLQQLYDNILWTIKRLEESTGRNISLVLGQSWKILQQQTACANGDRLRNELFSLKPKGGLSKNAKTLFDLQRPSPKGPFLSCKQEPSKVSGKYLIRLDADSEPITVFCEQKKFGGGWIVIQHRYDGSVDFFRNWTDYRNGFGDVDHEFWIGLESLHQITSFKPCELLVELESYTGDYRYAHFKVFKIGTESDGYPLAIIEGHSGTAGDSLNYHKEMKFTTYDNDNDQSTNNNAVTYQGAWWYKDGYHSSLNGRYINAVDVKSMNWYHFKNEHGGLRYSRMMIRET